MNLNSVLHMPLYLLSEEEAFLHVPAQHEGTGLYHMRACLHYFALGILADLATAWINVHGSGGSMNTYLERTLQTKGCYAVDRNAFAWPSQHRCYKTHMSAPAD